jgi:hypothetical protein
MITCNKTEGFFNGLRPVGQGPRPTSAWRSETFGAQLCRLDQPHVKQDLNGGCSHHFGVPGSISGVVC